MEPLHAAFRIQLWIDKNSAASLFVTGSREEDDKRIYQETFDTLYSYLMLEKEEDSAQDQPPKENKLYPNTVEEAVQYLMEELSLKDKVVIAKMSADEVAELNLSVGNYIRHLFGLWDGNNHLMWSCAKEAGKGIIHEDEASAIILGRLALELEKTHKLQRYEKMKSLN
jgi:hypothetical protein